MKRIALLIETSRSYGRDLLRGVKRFTVEREPWSLFVEVRDLESKPPAWLKNWDGDGILTRSGSDAIAEAVKRVGVPAVELRSTQRGSGFPFVGVDNDAVGELVVDHLRERGFQNFGVYALTTEQFFVERRDSFVRQIETGGGACYEFQQSGSTERPSQWERQQQRLIQWLADLPKPIGIMACTDQLGCWLLDACGRAGIKVPEEVAVIGVEDDQTLTAMSTPPLSSVRLAGERIGFTAAKLLDQMMRGNRASCIDSRRPKLLPPLGIMTRQSSDVVAIEDPLLSAAIQYIRQHACEGIRVDNVLAHVPVSRSALERGFRSVLGRSPNREINRVRIEKAKEVLRMTDLPLEQVSRRAGFATPQYFSHLFKTTTGKTPGQYRASGSA